LLGYLYSVTGTHGDKPTKIPCMIGVERNHSSGETVIRLLKDGEPEKGIPPYPQLYRKRVGIAKRREDKAEDRYGWMTTGETRQPMLDELNQKVREFDPEAEIPTIKINCAETVSEMRTFVRADDGKPQAQEGMHDDRVISCAMYPQIARVVDTRPSRPPPQAEREYANTATGAIDYGWSR
jgi:hypothetical protein